MIGRDHRTSNKIRWAAPNLAHRLATIKKFENVITGYPHTDLSFDFAQEIYDIGHTFVFQDGGGFEFTEDSFAEMLMCSDYLLE